MLGSGDINVKGVVPPEGCIEPEKYFTIFRSRGAKIFQTETITFAWNLEAISKMPNNPISMCPAVLLKAAFSRTA